MNYYIMSKDMKSFSHSGLDAPDVYDRIKKFILSPESPLYGSKLCRYKEQKSGWGVNVRLFYRNQWHWKPYIDLGHRLTYITWLFFIINITTEYKEVLDKVVKDWVKEVGNE